MDPLGKRPLDLLVGELGTLDVTIMDRHPAAAEGPLLHFKNNPASIGNAALLFNDFNFFPRRGKTFENTGTIVPVEQLFDRNFDAGFAFENRHIALTIFNRKMTLFYPILQGMTLT